ncbi:helix-turn-helix domain-containing protein [Hymenobacter nivis]|uniref:HTH cro/C1-type domain-containing protein n=1 Tax=Hymenobacter nivis TaxID=1850093 RepID=A0A2Z3GEY1_9BACT|nr:helix-turn-helix domain-containing protein [Hymenobacter nivis]AWM31328.1 hypothetical protein DDQ68_00130 [Hymenobacter nivis]
MFLFLPAIMENSPGGRLRTLREILGFAGKQQEFADAVGLSQQSVSNMERGKTEPAAKSLAKIHKRFPMINLNWLVTGVGLPVDKSIGPMLPLTAAGEMADINARTARLTSVPAPTPVPSPGPTTGAETITHGETLIQLARAEALAESQAAQIVALALQVERLWAELGKSGGSPDAAAPFRLRFPHDGQRVALGR